MDYQTFEARYTQASKELRKAGIRVYRNIMGCCRSCVGVDKIDNATEPILWHYGGQGNRISLSGDYVCDDEGNYVEGIYLNHDNLTPELKDTLVEIFTKNGIVLDWDKSDGMCVVVKPKLSVAHRTDEEQAWLINTWLDKYRLSYNEMFEYSYRSRNFLDRFWSKASSGYTEDWFEAQFSAKRTEIDDQIEADKQRAIRQAKSEEQADLKARLIEALPEFDTKERFLMWLDGEFPSRMTLGESDVEDPSRLMSMEQTRFAGEFKDREDFAQKHYAEDVARLPKWVLDDLSWNNIAYTLARSTHLILSKRGWNEPTYVWKTIR